MTGTQKGGDLMRLEPVSSRPPARSSQETTRVAKQDVPPSPSSTNPASSRLVTPYQRAEPRSPGNTPETEASKLATLARSLAMQSDRDRTPGLLGTNGQEVPLQQQQNNMNQSTPRSQGRSPNLDVAANLLTVDVPVGRKTVTIRTPVLSATFEAEARASAGNGDVQLRPAERSVAAQVRLESGHGSAMEVSRSRQKGTDVSAGVEAEVVISHEKISYPTGSTGAARITEQKTSVSAGVTTGEDGKVWSMHVKGTTEATIDETYKVEQTAKVTISQDAQQVRNTRAAVDTAGLAYILSQAMSRGGVGVWPGLPGHYVLETGGY
jgi:hypothetical protein